MFAIKGMKYVGTLPSTKVTSWWNEEEGFGAMVFRTHFSTEEEALKARAICIGRMHPPSLYSLGPDSNMVYETEIVKLD